MILRVYICKLKKKKSIGLHGFLVVRCNTPGLYCVYLQAVCCDDHIHCCPHSKVCNLAAESCDDPRGFSPPVSWLTKVAALTLEVEDEKCDEKTRCPWGSTCCKMNSGQWACCPLPQVSISFLPPDHMCWPDLTLMCK